MDESGMIMAYGGGRTFADIVAWIVGIFNVLLPVFVALSLVLFFIGVFKYIKSTGEHEQRTFMLWGLVTLFVMLSMWGILRLMCNTVTGNGSCQPRGGGAVYQASNWDDDF